MSETASEGTFAVVGTDTGVGKTVVTAGLVGWLREDGVDARAVKPVQTGYPPDDDAEFVAEACETDDAATCIERLEPPLAPRVAAEQIGASLSYAAIREGCERALATSEVGVLEGVGGVRVPLVDDREVIDLVADLELPAVVVARSGLGTLNHTALTVEALAARGVRTHAVVLNEYAGETIAERTNGAELERMTGVPVHTLPSFDLATPADAVPSVRRRLDRDVFPDNVRRALG
ncbi:dethiobiotin synthase [Halococcus saccharolyticus]|uniref:ATP-dependent dethiobiotin synthetase BioD n=1 Tax=Halococcus saccharolyticus DSM 5350 TaxID=1227455 RepID=M0MBN8_9EURY|nr:dethiobiotin synthase [Halococcus saccharolyticus]EMA42763.1 dethiobiotin synthase [Halococcus saccharolyticus DSM 5350]